MRAAERDSYSQIPVHPPGARASRALAAALLAAGLAAAALPAAGLVGPPGLVPIQPVPTGLDPQMVAVDPVLHRVFVASPGWHHGAAPLPAKDRVYVINAPPAPAVPPVPPLPHTSAGSIHVGAPGVATGPYGIAANPATHKVYVSNYLEGKVVVLDGAALVELKRIPGVPLGTGVAVDPVANLVYVASWTGAVFVIDGATDTLLGPLSPSGIKMPTMVEVDPLRGLIYTAEWGGDPTGNDLYVWERTPSVLGLPSPPVHAFVGTVTIPPPAHPPRPGLPPPAGLLTDIAVNPVCGDVYVGQEHGGVVRVDLASMSIVAMSTEPLAFGFGTWGVEYDAVNHHVYTPTYHFDEIRALQGTTLDTLSLLVLEPPGEPPGHPMKLGPHFTAFDPVSRFLYVTNEVRGEVLVLKDETLPLGPGLAPETPPGAACLVP